jgi:hypothetical protein
MVNREPYTEYEMQVMRDKVAKLERENEKLQSKVCDECLEYKDDGTPYTTYGWNENREEGQVACACIAESGPYRVLKHENEELRRWVEHRKTESLQLRAQLSQCIEAVRECFEGVSLVACDGAILLPADNYNQMVGAINAVQAVREG